MKSLSWSQKHASNNFIGANFFIHIYNLSQIVRRKEKHLDEILLNDMSMEAGNYVSHIVEILNASLNPFIKELGINAPTMINLWCVFAHN